MQLFTIEATSLESAQGIELALRGFDYEHELVDDDGRYAVEITLPGGDHGIVAVLDALERYVCECGAGFARVRLDGQSYTLEAPPPDV